jgi:hypothetical protein
MMNMRQRVDELGTLPVVLGVWAVIASAGEIVRSASAAVDGETYAIVRIALACVGLAAAALFWIGRNGGRDGMLGIMVWGVLQMPFVANQPDGNFTRQLVDMFAGVSTSMTVNGVITDYSQTGINLVGVAIAIGANVARKRLHARDPWVRQPLPAS